MIVIQAVPSYGVISKWLPTVDKQADPSTGHVQNSELQLFVAIQVIADRCMWIEGVWLVLMKLGEAGGR
jgi:hypothetical protein